MELLACNPRAVDFGGSALFPANPAAHQGAAPRPHLEVVRPGWVILAQFEDGRIAAVVTTHPDDWRDEAVRLQQAVFGKFTAFRFKNVDMARAALDDLAREVLAQYGTARICMDQRLSKIFLADWPIVLDTFCRQTGLGVPV